MTATAPPHVAISELDGLLRAVEPSALLVPARILRRVIRLDRRVNAWGGHVPHAKSYAIRLERLLEHVTRFELELDGSRELPDTVLLLERPEPEEFEHRPPALVLYEYSRRLFHLRVHVEMERRIAARRLTEADVYARLRALGAPQYAEIRNVLQRDEMLLPPRTDMATYVEFAAVFLELRYFAPEQLPWHFPALLDYDRVAELLALDIDHAALYRTTRLPGAADLVPWDAEDQTAAAPAAAGPPPSDDPLRPSPPAYWRLIARAERYGQVGNVVKAAILRSKAARLALPDRVAATQELAQAELDRLATRLQNALHLTDQETREWAEVLTPLLPLADRQYRTVESRLLYDLQKVCVEQERGLFTVDPLGWLRSVGRIPLRRPLSLLRDVMVAKHLQAAARKLTRSRLSGAVRERLAGLIEAAAQRARQQVRDRVRPMITEILTAEGLRPYNVPEQVAFHKIAEELVDRVAEEGYLSLGHLRDAVSQNSLKLPDLTRVRELLSGDLLLRVDRRLATVLDGVYHRGPIYLRMSQRLSAMAFGTRAGRLFTRYLAIPFGGAFLGVEFLRHVVHWFVPEPATEPGDKVWSTLVLVTGADLALGVFLLLLLEWTAFRRGCRAGLRHLGRGLRWLFYEAPRAILRWEWVRRFLDSVLYAVLVGYGVKPAVFTGLFVAPWMPLYGPVTGTTVTITFLSVNLFLNSPLGRYLEGLASDHLLRTWRELRMRLLAATLRVIIDGFQWILRAIEQVIYKVDEWLLFRRGERAGMLLAKAVLSVAWSFITYVVRFLVTLLIEPQINPLKHFPVVTVSHKIIAPWGLAYLPGVLTPLGLWATPTATAITFLLPGVFGFLAWELKENWRLYAANRPRHLKPSRIGSHGESMLRLLRLGIHSGTLPRRFGRLRRAGRKAIGTDQRKAIREHLQALHHVEESLQHFVERELLKLLALCRPWGAAPPSLGRVHLAAHQVGIELHLAGYAEPVWLEFQERAGWLLADIPRRGWLDQIPSAWRDAFTNALVGLYKSAGVDMLWPRVAARLGPALYWHDLIPEGILFWRDEHAECPQLCLLRGTATAADLETPVLVLDQPSPAVLDELLFSRTPLDWDQWTQTWQTPDGPVRTNGEPT